MQQKSKTVLGMYSTRAGVECAVEAFRDAGFRSSDISLVLPEKMSAEHQFVGTLRSAATKPLNCDDAEISVLGRNGAGYAGEYLTQELAAALVNMGVPECETECYAEKVLHGKALLSVHCESAERTVTARRLHGDLGGMDVFITRQPEVLGRFYRALAFSAGD